MAKAKRIPLKCNAPASAGIKLVLLTRFEELQSWRKTALDWNDPEGVHSMRVASRRLRSALRDFMPYVRKRFVSPTFKELKYIADALGDVRDHDVAIPVLEELQKRAPHASDEALKQLIHQRKELREQAREELKAILEKDELKRLEADFVDGVAGATEYSERKLKQAPSRPEPIFRDVSRAVILDRLREFEKLSNSLFEPFDVEALHEMRIAAKRLRYTLELSQPCWPRFISTVAKRAARMQTALGDLHDCDVWIETLGKQIVRARKQKERERVIALVRLLNHFVDLRTKHLRRALTRWREWEVHDTSGRLRTTLAPKEQQTEPPVPVELPAAVESSAGQADPTSLVAVG